MSNRHGRAEDLFKKVLAETIVEKFESAHPEYGIVSVVSVDISSDHSYADIGVRSATDSDGLAKALAERASDFRKALAKGLPLRRVPVLRFHGHAASGSADDIYALLDKISQESASNDDDERTRQAAL